MDSSGKLSIKIKKNVENPTFQVRYIASTGIRSRAYLAGEIKSSYIITRQFFIPSAMRWVSEPITY